MENKFQENLKKLSKIYTQKELALKTGFSQSSINNYLSKTSEPSMSFLIALKDALGINIDDFLFEDFEIENKTSNDKFIGNYMVYYYNNNSYKGEVHNSLKNVLNYGIISIVKEKEFDNKVQVVASFSSDRWAIVKRLKELNNLQKLEEITQKHSEYGNIYYGDISNNEQSIFINISNNNIGDKASIILNNPPSKNIEYLGGVGTINTIARGREHNPCVQYIIISKKILDMPEGEIYKSLKLDNYKIDMDEACVDMLGLLKNIYLDNSEIAMSLTDDQKQAIIKNKLEYHFQNILDANMFRFAKISNKEDDYIYKLIKEGVDG